MPPCRSSATRPISSHCAFSLTSAQIAETSPSRPRSPSTVASSAALSRPVISTRAPLRAKTAAMPRPMPLLPPVTTTDRPATDVNIAESSLVSDHAVSAGRQVATGELARAGGVAGADLLALPRVGVGAHPGDQQQPAQHHEGGQHVHVLVAGRADGAVAAQPGLLPLRQPRVVLEEGDRGAEVVH